MTDSSQDTRLVSALQKLRARVDQLEARRREPIAIVGMGCRFPGSENGPAAFWELLRDGRDASREITRWDASVFGTRDEAGTSYTRRASQLDRIDEFDSGFFEIMRREAEAMDPQQRMALEVTYEAISNAALSLDELHRRPTSVFLGIGASEYASGFGLEHTETLQYVGTGNLSSIAAGRIAYVFDLTGPVMAIDTACSSALVAVHTACESLRSGTSDVAIAGGVTLHVTSDGFVALSALSALAADGRSKAWDASADGYGRGEGCGMVVMKRLSDAQRDGDRIWAVIRASAINSDGRSAGLTAPNPRAQAAVIRTALAFGGIRPDSVQYVEAHGTGTVLGDPIEVEALGEVFAERAVPLAVGTVKSNIGHLELAAGVAGLMKTVLALHHRELPASLHFKTPNPHIAWDAVPVRVQKERGPWPQPNAPLVAGVSAFGLSGTNAHVIVDEAPVPDAAETTEAKELAARGDSQLLVVSAKTDAALRAYAARYADMLEAPATDDRTYRDIAYTASARTTHFDHRLSVMGTSRADWAAKLRKYLAGDVGLVTSGAVGVVAPRIAMVFGGQGSQWYAMGRELLRDEPVFRATVEAIAAKIDALAPWRLLEELARDEATSRVHETQIAQPALFAVQVGLFELWRSWGVAPSAVAGHSLGEISASYVAGALSLDDATRLVVERGRILQKATGLGKMASVGLGARDAERFVADHAGVEVGAYNGPHTSVFTGAPAAIDRALAALRERGVDHKELRVDYAFHSAQMAELAAELADSLRQLEPRTPTIELISTVTGTTAPRLDAAYWADQVRKPVRFHDATQTLIARGHDVFLEIGAHPVLVPMIEETLEAAGAHASLISTLHRKRAARATTQEALGTLYCTGYPIDWSKQFIPRGRVATLPSYPWRHEPFWIKTSRARTEQIARLFDRHVEISDEPGKHVFDAILDTGDPRLAFLAGGQGRERTVVPLSVFSAFAWQGAVHALGEQARALRDLRADRPLDITADEPRHLQLIVAPVVTGVARFQVFSRGAAGTTLHASGAIAVGPAVAIPAVDVGAVRARCTREVPGVAGFDGLRAGDNEVFAAVRPFDVGGDAAVYAIHPAVLDACLAALLAATTSTASASEIGSIVVTGIAARAVWLHARWTTPSTEAEVVLLDADGGVVLHATGVRVRSEVRASRARAKQDDPRVIERVAAAATTEERVAIVLDYLRTTIGRLLGVTEPLTTIPLTRFGIDSLVVVRLRNQLRRGLGVEIPAAWLPTQTIDAIAAHALELMGGGGGASSAGQRNQPDGFVIQRATAGESYPAMHGQTFFWSLGKDYPSDPDTNALPLLIEGPLDVDATVRTVERLFRRHSVFSTRYHRLGNDLMQSVPTVSEAPPVRPEWLDLSALVGDEQKHASDAFLRDLKGRPFDIDNGPYLRAGLVKLAAERHILIIVIHHIAFDAGGMPGLFRDLTELYTSATQRPAATDEVPLQYVDYAASVHLWEQTPHGRSSREYWERALLNARPVELPVDFPRAPVDARRDLVPLGLAHDPVHQFKHVGAPFAAVRQRADALGVTPYAVFVATFAKFLQETSGQNDLCIETLYVLRAESELANVQGMMTNVLLTRVDMTGSFDDVIRRTKEALDAGHEHGYARVSKISAHPLRRVSFNYVPLGKFVSAEPLQFGPRTLAYPQAGAFSMENLARPWDVQVMLQDSPEHVMLRWMCSQPLFRRETAERWFQRFVEMLS